MSCCAERAAVVEDNIHLVSLLMDVVDEGMSDALRDLIEDAIASAGAKRTSREMLQMRVNELERQLAERQP